MKSQRENSIHHNKIERGKHHMTNYINKARDTSRSCQLKNTREREREREIKHIATGIDPQP
jgi:hypothetical protein